MKGKSLVWLFGFMFTATLAGALVMLGMLQNPSTEARPSPAAEMNYQRESRGILTNDPVEQSRTKAYYEQQNNSDMHVVTAYPDVSVYEALMYLPSNTDSLSVVCGQKTFGVVVNDVPTMAKGIFKQCGLNPSTFTMYYTLQ